MLCWELRCLAGFEGNSPRQASRKESSCILSYSKRHKQPKCVLVPYVWFWARSRGLAKWICRSDSTHRQNLCKYSYLLVPILFSLESCFFFRVRCCFDSSNMRNPGSSRTWLIDSFVFLSHTKTWRSGEWEIPSQPWKKSWSALLLLLIAIQIETFYLKLFGSIDDFVPLIFLSKGTPTHPHTRAVQR